MYGFLLKNYHILVDRGSGEEGGDNGAMVAEVGQRIWMLL
jgi:hypothetical protein